MEAPQDVRVSFVDYQSVLLEYRGVYTTIREEPLEGYIVSIRLPLCFCLVVHTVIYYKSNEFCKCFVWYFMLLCCQKHLVYFLSLLMPVVKVKKWGWGYCDLQFGPPSAVAGP